MQIREAPGNSSFAFRCLSSARFILTKKPVPLSFSCNLWVCSQATLCLAFFRVLSPRGVRSSFCFHHVWAQTYPAPGKATLQTRSSPVVHILRAGLGHRAARRPGGSRITCCAKPETRERVNNEEELHMRRRSSCEGQVPGALLPVIHQIRDSVSHKSPRSCLRECRKSPCLIWRVGLFVQNHLYFCLERWFLHDPWIRNLNPVPRVPRTRVPLDSKRPWEGKVDINCTHENIKF